MSIFTGAAVAIVTPFNSDGSVNYEKLDDLIEYQIANGTDAIVICGTTGEASTLSHEEHIDVIGHCVKTVNKRVPVIAGTGSNSTETAIYLSKEAQAVGADAVLLVTPYYNKATQGGLDVHFKDTDDFTLFSPYKVPAVVVQPKHALPECAVNEPYNAYGCRSDKPHCITQITPETLFKGFKLLKEKVAKKIIDTTYIS